MRLKRRLNEKISPALFPSLLFSENLCLHCCVFMEIISFFPLPSRFTSFIRLMPHDKAHTVRQRERKAKVKQKRKESIMNNPHKFVIFCPSSHPLHPNLAPNHRTLHHQRSLLSSTQNEYESPSPVLLMYIHSLLFYFILSRYTHSSDTHKRKKNNFIGSCNKEERISAPLCCGKGSSSSSTKKMLKDARNNEESEEGRMRLNERIFFCCCCCCTEWNVISFILL